MVLSFHFHPLKCTTLTYSDYSDRQEVSFVVHLVWCGQKRQSECRLSPVPTCSLVEHESSMQTAQIIRMHVHYVHAYTNCIDMYLHRYVASVGLVNANRIHFRIRFWNVICSRVFFRTTECGFRSGFDAHLSNHISDVTSDLYGFVNTFWK
jgi:hypothetical protein